MEQLTLVRDLFESRAMLRKLGWRKTRDGWRKGNKLVTSIQCGFPGQPDHPCVAEIQTITK